MGEEMVVDSHKNQGVADYWRRRSDEMNDGPSNPLKTDALGLINIKWWGGI